jgi:Leucine-rich repeat (LRR) protein
LLLVLELVRKSVDSIDDQGCNKLKEVKDSDIEQLVKLEKLLLHNNMIERLPSLTALQSLRICFLAYNPLKSLPDFPSSLEELHLGSCNIKEFPFDALSTTLTNLRQLHLGKIRKRIEP